MLQPFKKASAVSYGTAQITRCFWGKYSEADAIQKAGDVPEPGCSGGGPEVGADSLLLPGRKRGAFPMAFSRVFSLRWLCVLSSPPSLQHSHDGKKRGPLPASLCTPPTFSLSICALRQKPRSAIAHVKRDGCKAAPFCINKLYPPFFPLCRLTLHFLRARQNLNARPRLPGKPDFKRNFLWLSFVFSWLQVVFICI